MVEIISAIEKSHQQGYNDCYNDNHLLYNEEEKRQK